MRKISPIFLLPVLTILFYTTNSFKYELNPKSGTAIVSLPEDTINRLSPEEKAQGWILLFDGKSLAGWKGYNKDNIPSRWIVKDGALQTAGKQEIKSDKELTGDIITVDQFESFELSWEWKITPQGNSGMIYHVVEGKNPE